ncbi:MAG: hypothetical protein WAT81_02070, partial [Candidatus Moraniibacteriota bacterium]
MSLADVNEDLHRRSREAEPVLPGDPNPIIQPKSVLPDAVEVTAPVVPLGVAWGGEEKHDEPIAPGMQPRNPLTRLPKKVVVLSGVIALALFAVGLFLKAGGWLFTPENVQVTITGPKRAESNESVEYVIRYENNNWVDLDEAELIISYPEFFQLETSDGFEVSGTRAVLPLGTVKKSSLNSVTIKGSFRSLQDQVALFTATLRAAPSGVSSRVDTEYQYSIAVESSVIIVELSVPSQAGDGQFADFVATYRNESPETVENLVLVIDYPEGFAYREATPLPSKNKNQWAIPSLAPGESGTVSVRGILAGAQGDVKRIFAKVGVRQGDESLLAYAVIERQTRMAASPLAILQKFGDSDEQQSVGPGEALFHRILFRNDGDVGLRDLIVTIDLNPKYFDVTRLDLRGGTYNVQKQQVVFRAGDRPVLSLIEPGQRGEIEFSAPIRSDLAQYKQNNIEIESIARIDSPDVPTPVGANKIIASNRAVFKVRTTPEFEVKGYHFDSYGNTGPAPLIVGQETQFTINVRVGSTINALEDAQVKMTVPGQVRYIKTQVANRGSVTYNDRTGEIFWNVGTIAPGTEQAAQLAIQIGITPD